MMEQLAINSYCKIKNNNVILDGNLFFISEQGKSFNEFIKETYKFAKVNYMKFFKMDNLRKLGFLTADIILQNKNIASEFKPEETGIILSNSSSSLDTDLAFYETIKNETSYFPSPSVFVYTLPNIMIGEICIKNKISGENAFFVFEKFDAEFIHSYVSDLFETGKIKCCITGWVELLKDNFESVIFLVKKTEDCINTKEYINFEPENLKNIWKN
jgi:hypothetical protein